MVLKTSRLAPLAAALLLTACGGGAEEAETTVDAETATEAPMGDQAAAETASAEPEMIEAPEGSMAANTMALGSDDAPLTIVEYASVTCPACAAFHAQIFPEIEEQFIETGQVRFEYREFPTPPARFAFAGFILARCAATDGGPEAYFGMLDALYRTQRQWIYGDNAPQALRNIAAQAGIDEAGFERCFRREDIRNVITETIEEGRDNGISRTPTLLIDGKPFDYGSSVDEAIARIQAEVDKRS
jgi:protein-disulfide isomerase